jgi:hypothetical protein
VDLERLESLASRVFFGLAFVLLAIAVIERVALWSGYTVLRGQYDPGRLIEFAAMLLLFVVAVLLRQIRQQLRSRA